MLIQLKNIVKTYNANRPNEVTALKEINLQIEQGEMCSISGPSGSGKSTLLNIIGCVDTQSCGEYLFNGERIDSMSDKKVAHLRNQKIGFVLQDFGLIRDRTVSENVKIPLYFSDLPYKDFSSHAQKTLERLKIYHLVNRKITELSGGQRQRVAIARAIIMKPDIILADEPTGALDTSTASEMVSALEELNKDGTTVIIVTHNPNIATRCRQRYTLTDGRIFRL